MHAFGPSPTGLLAQALQEVHQQVLWEAEVHLQHQEALQETGASYEPPGESRFLVATDHSKVAIWLTQSRVI